MIPKYLKTAVAGIGLVMFLGLFFWATDSAAAAKHKHHKSQQSQRPLPRVVSNSRVGLWGGVPQVELEQDLVIGQEDGDAKEIFGYIRDIAIDENDSVYIADSYELNIKIFDKNGRYLRQFGREGQGPGEFQTLDDICWSGFNQSLYTVDRRNHRICRFSLDGKLQDSVNDNRFKATIDGICPLEDGRFALTARIMGDKTMEYKIFIVNQAMEKIETEIEERFPMHSVGGDYFPRFSDVGALPGNRLYFTSPSEYRVVIFDQDLNRQAVVLKSHPKMFIPQYAGGFYADFNALSRLLPVQNNYLICVQSSDIKEIPLFKTKREFIKFTHTVDLREWNISKKCQLDFYSSDFRYLGCVEIPSPRSLAGKDAQNRLYFIENEPFPRLVRFRLLSLEEQ